MPVQFSLQTSTSVLIITGPVAGTSDLNSQDVIDVTDPVRAVAKKALADLCKTNQGVVPDGQKIIDTAVDVLKNLPKDQMPLMRSGLNKAVTKSGNM